MAILKINLSGHQSDELESQGFNFPGSLQVNPADSDLVAKVTSWLDATIHVKSGDHLVLAAPGLPALRDIVCAWAHGRTGQFPSMVHSVRETDGSFTWGQPLDLQVLRNDIARAQRPGTIKL